MEPTQGVRFDTLPLSPEILTALSRRGIEMSTPVQAGCIEPMLLWQDVIAKAPTGTGKTFAYGIPIIEHIDIEDESVQAVILAPTRELAMQITDELRFLSAAPINVQTYIGNLPSSLHNSLYKPVDMLFRSQTGGCDQRMFFPLCRRSLQLIDASDRNRHNMRRHILIFLHLFREDLILGIRGCDEEIQPVSMRELKLIEIIPKDRIVGDIILTVMLRVNH